MQHKRWWIGIVLGVAVLLRSPIVGAVESDPLPVPTGTPREQAVSAYNEGVKLARGAARQCVFAGKRPPSELPLFLALAALVASPRRRGVNTPF